MNILDWIECNPAVMMGKPVIKGTRLTVELILEELGNGASVEELLEEHPRLKREHIQAAIAYAAYVLKGEIKYSLAA